MLDTSETHESRLAHPQAGKLFRKALRDLSSPPLFSSLIYAFRQDNISTLDEIDRLEGFNSRNPALGPFDYGKRWYNDSAEYAYSMEYDYPVDAGVYSSRRDGETSPVDGGSKRFGINGGGGASNLQSNLSKFRQGIHLAGKSAGGVGVLAKGLDQL